MQTLFGHYPDMVVFWGCTSYFSHFSYKISYKRQPKRGIYFGSWFAGIVQPGREGLVAKQPLTVVRGVGGCFSHLD